MTRKLLCVAMFTNAMSLAVRFLYKSLDHTVIVLERETENNRKGLTGRCKKTAWAKKISDRKEFN
jgi:hypothetical protein